MSILLLLDVLNIFILPVLSIAPGDEDAIRCKVVALIKADSIDDALSTIQSSQKILTDFSFFKVSILIAFR